MKLLINRKSVKDFALQCGQSRAHKFTRVAKSFYESIDADIRDLIRRRISYLPSKGKTID